MKVTLGFRTLALAAAVGLLAPDAGADGTVSLNNYDSGYGIWLVQNGVTNPAPAGTMVQVLGGPDANHLSAVTNTLGVDGSTISSGDINALGSGTGSFFDFGFGPVSGVSATSNAVLQVVAWYDTAIGASALWTQATGSDPAPSGSPPPVPTPAILNLPGPIYILASGSAPSVPPGLTTSEPTGAGSQGPLEGAGAGCGLSLAANTTSSNAILLTLFHTRPGQTYQIWSLTNLWLTNWVLESSLVAAGDSAQTNIAMGQRPDLFLRAWEFRDYQTNLVFKGLTHYSNNVTLVPNYIPDTMGAVGPNQFVELLNGFIAVYDKSGNLISQAYTTNFFAVTNAGTSYPTSDLMLDPRILYDQQSQRWVACAIDGGNNPSQQAILAVSNGDNPTNLATGWTKYLVPVQRANLLTDFTTLGLDANGIYLAVAHYGSENGVSTNAGHTVVAIKKPQIYTNQFVSTIFRLTNGLPFFTIQPVVNFDAVSASDFAWFVAKGLPDYGTNYQGGAIWYGRLQWTNTTAVGLDTNWFVVSNSGPTYRDYYDLDGTGSLTLPTNGVFAPQPAGPGGQTNSLSLYGAGSRLMTAVIRNGSLWTCHTVGLSGTNGAYNGDQSGASVDRSAVQWLKLQVNTSVGTLLCAAHGRIFDATLTANAMYYYVPSLMVNCAGDMVTGFSGSSVSNYVSAYYSWRLASGVGLNQPRLLQVGTTFFDYLRWGDYSATTIDPTDDWSFWTVQEYSDALQTRSAPWATVVAKIRPAP